MTTRFAGEKAPEHFEEGAFGLMDIPFLDLSVKDPQLRQELLAAVDRVLDHGMFTHGPEVEALEQTIEIRVHAIVVDVVDFRSTSTDREAVDEKVIEDVQN